jgi:hypothetical protein
MEAAMTYAVQHKTTRDFFAGFADGGIRWVKFAADAWRADVVSARAQAALLICNGVPAQRQVVAL